MSFQVIQCITGKRFVTYSTNEICAFVVSLQMFAYFGSFMLCLSSNCFCHWSQGHFNICEQSFIWGFSINLVSHIFRIRHIWILHSLMNKCTMLLQDWIDLFKLNFIRKIWILNSLINAYNMVFQVPFNSKLLWTLITKLQFF